MGTICGLVSSAIGWCAPFLVNWIIYRFIYKDKRTSGIFLYLLATAFGCHFCALVVFLCFDYVG